MRHSDVRNCGDTGSRIRNFILLAVTLALTGQTRSVLGATPNKSISQFALTTWSKENGLPSNEIRRSIQTSDGYLWFATAGGLVRFNGAEFKVFDKKNTPGLGSYTILYLLESQDGALWIATDSGLSCYRAGKFVTYTTVDGLPSNTVKTLYEDRTGTLWIGTFGGGLCSFKAGKFTAFSKSDGLLNGFIFCLGEDGDGGLLIGTYGGGLFKFKDGQFKQYKDPGQGEDSVIFIHHARNGELLVGKIPGLFIFKDGRFTEIQPEGVGAFSLINCILEDRHGGTWIADSNRIVRMVDGRYEAFGLQATALKGKAYWITEDREGDIWVSTLGNGLGRFQDNKLVTFTGPANAALDTVGPILADRNGGLWVSVPGTLSYFKNDPAVQSATPLLDLSIPMPRLTVFALYQARDGALWIGTTAGLYRYREGKLTSFTTRDGLPGSLVSSIAQTADGTIWASCNNGLARFDGSRFEAYSPNDSFQIDSASLALASSDGNLWMVTNDGVGLLRNGRLQSFGVKEGLSSVNITGIYEDADHDLWVTTSDGLNRLRDEKFTKFTTKEGLSGDDLISLMENNGEFWLASKNGIIRVSKQDLNDFAAGKITSFHSVRYGAADGMLSPECSPDSVPSIARTPDGKLWFATVKGLILLDPSDLRINPVAPPVKVEEFMVDHKDVAVNDSLQLSPGTKELEFRYSALTFKSPEAVGFKYKLEGFDSDWIDAGSRRVAYYTNLGPGNYRFLVKARNSDGVWNETGAVTAFYLKPHFYQTYLFYGLCVAAILVLAAAAYQFRIRQLKAREKEMAGRIDEALAQVKVLSGLLPICASCKMIRDEQGNWSQIESYIHQHSQVDFSHGICPGCIAKLYPDLAHLMDEP